MASANTDYDNLGLIPVDLNLNGRSFVLDQSRGVFVADKGSDDAISADARARMQEMQNEMKQMKVAQRDLASKMKELEVTNRSLEFKNQVLLELLAAAQLDAEAASEKLEHERLISELLKRELMGRNFTASGRHSQPPAAAPTAAAASVWS